MAEEVLWTLDADSEPTLAAFDQIDAAATAMGDALSEAVSGMTDQFATLTAAMDELSQMTADGAAAADVLSGSSDALAESLDNVAAAAATSGEALAAVGEAAATTAEAEATDEAATFSLSEAMTTLGETATGVGEALTAAQMPLMMIGMAASMVGGKLVGMGMDGQKGEALLSGMAGASQADIIALQGEALKLGLTMDKASAGFYEVESAGYSGSQAITVFDAAMKLAEGGQANAQDVTAGLTAIMHDYNAGADQATHYTDLMAEAILRGKQSAQDFTSNIGPLASAGANVGLSFEQVAAAESTMTQISPKVALDAQQLRQLFNFLSPTMGGVAKAAHGLHLKFDEAHYSSLDLLGKLQYLAQISGGTSTAAFVKLTGGIRGSTAAIDLLKNGGKTFEDNLHAMGHAAGTTAHAFDSWESTIPAHLDKVGAALSVFATKTMDALGPKLIPIIDKVTTVIGQMSDLIINHTSQVMPILAGLAAVIGGVLIAAIASFVVAAAPIIGIALAIGIVVAGVVWAFQHWGDIMKQVNSVLQMPVIHTIVKMLQDLWGFIVSNFMPVWQQLINLWQTQLVPLGKQLWAALQPLMPLFGGIAIIIGAVLLVALGLLVGVLTAVIKGLAGFLSGLVIVIGGVVQLFTGLVQIISGILRVIIDLVTLNFSDLGPALGQIWQGIINVFLGAWNIIRGIFLTAWYTIAGIVTGFVQGIIGFFTRLWDSLVGHSIIPDMVKGILEWFTNLVNEGIAFITHLVVMILMWMVKMEVMVLVTVTEMVHIFLSWLDNLTGGAVTKAQNVVSGITGVLGKLGGMALQWGSDMINGFIQGIKNAAGGISNAVSGVATTIRNFLHFSKPDEGPLADSDTYGRDFMELYATSLESGTGRLKQALNTVAGSMATNISPNVTLAGAPGGLSGGGGVNPVFLQMLQVLQRIEQQQRGGGSSSNVSSNLTMHNSFSGVSNMQEIYALFDQIAGTRFESGLRGSY